MTAACNACYYSSTRPEWVALLVIRSRVDQPCERHALALVPGEVL